MNLSTVTPPEVYLENMNLLTRTLLEQEAPPPLLRHWNSLTLGSADYRNFGELVAWRATLWRGNQLLSEQKSFLW